MSYISEMKQKVLDGYEVTFEEALVLSGEPLEELAAAADEIRRKKCGSGFDLCTIINGKCGKCSEDCKYCAQSAHYHTECRDTYPLLSTEKLLAGAKHNKEQGVL